MGGFSPLSPHGVQPSSLRRDGAFFAVSREAFYGVTGRSAAAAAALRKVQVKQGSGHGRACRCNGSWVSVVHLRERLLGDRLCLFNRLHIKVRGEICRLCKH
jgi:hypothetical protein